MRVHKPPCNSDFELRDPFTDDDWVNSPEGTIFNINIPLDDGDVVCSEDYWNGDLENEPYYGYYWRFSTLRTGNGQSIGTDNGFHPVAGNRQFGLFHKGSDIHTFYTLGVDRVKSATLLFPAALAGGDNLWKCLLQEEIGKFAETRGATVVQDGDGNTQCRPSIKNWIKLWNENCNPLQEVDDLANANCIQC